MDLILPFLILAALYLAARLLNRRRGYGLLYGGFDQTPKIWAISAFT